MTDKRAGRAPALFDDALFAEDIKRASNTGREVALAARADYEPGGVPLDDLLACEEEGPEGTVLAHCMKIYLPRPVGKFGMVFRIALRNGKAQLVYAAFGVRTIRATRTSRRSTKSPTIGSATSQGRSAR